MEVARIILRLMAMWDIIGMFAGALVGIEGSANDDDVHCAAGIVTACASAVCGIVAALIYAALSPA